jgi:hypothetical protein
VAGAAASTSIERARLALRFALSGGVPRRSLEVALVVGSILNLINQGDRLFAGQPLDLAKLALTYCVPYFVATYGAVAFRLYALRNPARGAAGCGEDGDERC